MQMFTKNYCCDSNNNNKHSGANGHLLLVERTSYLSMYTHSLELRVSSGEERIYTVVSDRRRPAGWSSGHRVTEDCLQGFGTIN